MIFLNCIVDNILKYVNEFIQCLTIQCFKTDNYETIPKILYFKK